MTDSKAAQQRAAEWVYSGVWRILSDWFRVPPTPPSLPAMDGEKVDAFKPAPRYLSYLKVSFFIGLLVIDLVIFIIWLVLTIEVWWLGLILAVPALFIAVVPDILAYVAIHLRYDTTWYVMSDRSLRIRGGAWVIHEMTFTFENVQNVKVQQGPIQRLFGISDLIVETAGSSGDPTGKSGPALNTGRIEGIANADALRDRVLEKLKASRRTGVGCDLDEDHGSTTTPVQPAWTAEHLQTLRAIRDEVALVKGT